MALVAARFGAHFGDVEGFAWPVTAQDAHAALDDFVARPPGRFRRLPGRDGERRADAVPRAGLDQPQHRPARPDARPARAAEAAWREGRAPLNAVEGFIRQILGWREYVRGIYWLLMPGYAQTNALDATRPLPGLLLVAARPRCAASRRRSRQTRDLAYAHHIQRLMVTGNFALLAGLDPARGERLVPRRLCRRLRMGGTAQHARHGDPCRWRGDGVQALCGLGCLHQPHVGLLRRLRATT